ncbi:MAG: NAD(P)/FAD-dependent oxidoreductase [Clostridia bacterium]|nr:NAD(P)/FAD-dependent oxidoreductase [Clostridia bacterium]
MYDCIIIGGGPAGLSAALYTVRAGLSTLVIARDGGTLGSVAHIQNYFGFASPVSGNELARATRENLLSMGCNFLDDEVTSLTFGADGYEVRTARESFETPCVLLALGKGQSRTTVPNADSYIGSGVSRCAVCDGFFFRGRAVAVVGEGDYALSEASELTPLAASVTLMTDGKPIPESFIASGLPCEGRKIVSLRVEEVLKAAVLDDGSELELDGLFIAQGSAGAAELALKLGIPCSSDGISVSPDGSTALPGIYAAGDCAGKPYQISVAVGEGAKAGLAMIEYVRKKRNK